MKDTIAFLKQKLNLIKDSEIRGAVLDLIEYTEHMIPQQGDLDTTAEIKQAIQELKNNY